MQSSAFTTVSTETLQNRKRLNNFALFIVTMGVAIAIGVSFYNYFTIGEFAKVTFNTALVASLVALPIYFERKRIVKELEHRMD